MDIGSRLVWIWECEDLSFPNKHTLAKIRCDQILMRTCIVRCSDSEFSLWQFSTARLEVLPNLRHAVVFQMSMMVNFGIGLTRRWAFSLRLRKITGDIQIPACWKVIWKWEMSCHAILNNLYEPKMDVILTISFKITAEIEIRKFAKTSVSRLRLSDRNSNAYIMNPVVMGFQI